MLFRSFRRLLTTLAPAFVLAGCEDRPLPTAVPTERPSRTLAAGDCAVTSTADAGDGSLRARIADPACSTITFDLPFPATITLTSGTLRIERNVSMEGPGADKLTVARSLAAGTPLFGVFFVHFQVTAAAISGVTISNGKSPGGSDGAGIRNLGVLTLSHSFVTENTTEGTGGGISNSNTMLITHSLVANNHDGAGGAGILNLGSLTLAHSTVSGNTSRGGAGGVQALGPGADMVIIHSTITGNTSSSGGGISVRNGASARIRNSVIAGNILTEVHNPFDPSSGGEGPDVWAPERDAVSVVVSYSLIGSPRENSITATPENGNLIGTVDTPLDAKLGPLALNAPGVTATHALLEGSPAIDGGVCTDLLGNVVTDDQRGVARPQGITCDMGAYEAGPTAYYFGGFLSPVTGGNVLNGAKAGQTIPLKWRLTDASGAPVTNLTTATVTVTSLACTLGSTANQVEEAAANTSGLQNLGNGYYQFNWKTPTSYAASCKTMHLDLGEGLTRNALFEFKK